MALRLSHQRNCSSIVCGDCVVQLCDGCEFVLGHRKNLLANFTITRVFPLFGAKSRARRFSWGGIASELAELVIPRLPNPEPPLNLGRARAAVHAYEPTVKAPKFIYLRERCFLQLDGALAELQKAVAVNQRWLPTKRLFASCHGL